MSDLLDDNIIESSINIDGDEDDVDDGVPDVSEDELECEVFDVASGRRWDPLGEEKETDEVASITSKDFIDE